MDSSTKRRILVCSRLPSVASAIRSSSLAKQVMELRPEDLQNEEVSWLNREWQEWKSVNYILLSFQVTKSWAQEVVVADRDFIPLLFDKPKEAILFVQVQNNSESN